MYSFQFKLNVHLMQIQATLALETNCGHVYCGNCILEVKISREKYCLLVGPSQKSKQSCAEMLLSGVAAKQCTASNGVPILPSENHHHPPIFLPGTQLSRPYMLNRKYYLVAKKNHHIPEYWQRCFYPWTGRKRHSRSGRDWAEERTVDRSAHLQQAILRRAENSPWNDQVWENKWCDISVSLLFRDLPVLLRHLVHYLLSGEGLHLAFQLRFFRNLNLSIWT